MLGPVYEESVVQDMVVIVKGAHLVALKVDCIYQIFIIFRFTCQIEPGPSCQIVPPKSTSHRKLVPGFKIQVIHARVCCD